MAIFRTVAVLKRHVSQIRPGDVVWHRNDWRTVSGTDLKRQPDGTLTLFGSSFWEGHEPIAVADIRQTNPLGAHTMATFSIRSRKLRRTFAFSLPAGEHVYVNINNQPGTLGRRPCLGGGFQGSALTATEATLESVARRWWRQYLAKQSA